jgi:hypothetical protein
MDIKTPEQLITLLEQVPLQGKQKFELNRVLANHTRKFFRGQIKSQRDVDGKAYKPRKKRVNSINENGKIASKRNMLMGMSRNLKTAVTSDSFSVGLAGLEGHIAEVHNEGKSVVYARRINGFFNNKTNLWKGGTKQKASYQMPKRTMVGWAPELQRELTQIIFQHIQPQGQ